VGAQLLIPSLPSFSPSSASFPPLFRPLLPVTAGEAVTILQWVQTKPGGQTTFDAFWTENASGESILVQLTKELLHPRIKPKRFDGEIYCRMEARFYGYVITHVIFPVGARAAKHPRSRRRRVVPETPRRRRRVFIGTIMIERLLSRRADGRLFNTVGPKSMPNSYLSVKI